MPAVHPAQNLVGHETWSPGGGGSPWCTPSEFQCDYEWGNAFFSFDVGMAHVVSLNCYSRTNTTSVQYLWLESDLAGLNRTLTPWVIVLVHCPFYSTNDHHYHEWQTDDMQDSMEPLFYKYGVNIVIAGHVHAYQRCVNQHPRPVRRLASATSRPHVLSSFPCPHSYLPCGSSSGDAAPPNLCLVSGRSNPVYKTRVNDTFAPTYIVVGEGGNREGHATGYHKPSPAWSAFTNDTQFGHGTVSIYNHTHLRWQWHINVEPAWFTQDDAWVLRPETTSADNGLDDDQKDGGDGLMPEWVVWCLSIFGTAVVLGENMR